MRLLTERLVIRPIRREDALAIFEHASRPGVARTAGFPTPRSLADSRRHARLAAAEWRKAKPARRTFSIISKEEGAWIGSVSLRWAHGGLGEIGYSLHPRHWGRGYAPEAACAVVETAFESFGAHRVQATCWVENARSIRVLRKIGFRKEGRLRGYLKRGAWVRDEFMFAMTRADWRKAR